MSISKEQLEYYKLDHKTIQRINSRRLKKHVDSIFSMERGFFCGCCGEPYYQIYEANREVEFEKHQAVKRYLHFIVKTLKSKPDYEEMIESERLKRMARSIKQKNKGSQKLSKSKRKKNRLEVKNRKKFLERYAKEKRNAEKVF